MSNIFEIRMEQKFSYFCGVLLRSTLALPKFLTSTLMRLTLYAEQLSILDWSRSQFREVLFSIKQSQDFWAWTYATYLQKDKITPKLLVITLCFEQNLFIIRYNTRRQNLLKFTNWWAPIIKYTFYAHEIPFNVSHSACTHHEN